ncbi:hypothetical protein HWV62_7704 [Athelia sp. TMB]|nr:hypothetical protein HWV62_7704 [Athelia sp. TMB]
MSISPSRQGRPPRNNLIKETDGQDHQTGKENKSTKAGSGKGKGKISGKVSARSTRAASKKAHCLCKRPDDGTPMVSCSECRVWYHFNCVDLSDREAEDISIYICPSCTKATGRRTVMDWEGPEAIEECVDPRHTAPREPTPHSESEHEEHPAAIEESDDAGSGDEYVADASQQDNAPAKKRRTRRLSISSESESDEELKEKPSRHSKVAEKRETPTLKRKPATTAQAPSKRQKSSAFAAVDDPTRRYCLQKLQEIFSDIFLRYGYQIEEAGDEVPSGHSVEKMAGDLAPEDKGRMEDQAKAFTAELEQSLFDLYAEHDAKGKASAGSKYKERFRMLTFNLPKSDRATLHQRIASLKISPKELSLMSSTDLADEETKQSIKIAEEEALAHSILTKTVAPRAKITHKGMVDIEDVNTEGATMREREREREREEEERREREKAARLRAAQMQQRRPSLNQGSVPPESPVTPSQASPGGWGRPPALPLHAMHAGEGNILGPSRSPTDATFAQSPVDMHSFSEPQLDLADLINIDDDPTSQDAGVSPIASVVQSTDANSTIVATLPPQSPVVQTGISPFAAGGSRPEHVSRSSFDLNALWTAPSGDKPSQSASPPPSSIDEPKADLTEVDVDGQEADDQDFDMFLDDDRDDTPAEPVDTSPEALQAQLMSQPHVWAGKISMPLDSTIPQETPVVARQIGGRSLEASSLLWRTLFPADLLRIDGRVPVNASSDYLLQMRMNSTKELIAVALSPTSPADVVGYKTLSDYLVGKSRHGLIFPWGQRPKDIYPGRELYIIPILASEPLPDYMELLDELRLPSTRTSDYLVGIWVLNKGKLAPPPQPLAGQSPAPVTAPTASQSPPVQPFGAPPPTAPLVIAPEVLAAEVASLTPEQIQLMLQTLAGNPAFAPATAPPAPPPPHMPPPTMYPRAAADFPNHPTAMTRDENTMAMSEVPRIGVISPVETTVVKTGITIAGVEDVGGGGGENKVINVHLWTLAGEGLVVEEIGVEAGRVEVVGDQLILSLYISYSQS